MRKLVVWNLMTLDGHFEGPAPWDLAFHNSVWGEELAAYSLEQAKEIGTLLFGRMTYEGMAAHWTTAEGAVADFMNGVEKVVASRTLDAATWTNSRLLQGEVPGAVLDLKRQPGGDIYVFGSADLTASLLRHGLVDEYRLCLAPVVLGAGHPLFKPSDGRLEMTLLETRPLKTGGVILRYAVPGGG
ncbi:MAG: dihydrofolate reductase [Luteitalea sp.]|nr:dihydrofolate reductase [Luteitalea sp.]